MDKVNKIIDNFYSNFVLRDLLSFITPGAISIFSSLTLIFDFQDIINFFSNISLLIFIPALGLFYSIGYSLQFLGVTIRIINKDENQNDKERIIDYKNIIKISNKKNTYLMLQRERLVILKQMTGNNAMALSIFIIIFSIKKFWFSGLNVVALILMILLTFFLFLANNDLVKRQENWEKACLES